MVFFKSRFFILTGLKDEKTIQIRKNNQVEACYLVKDEKGIGYIRISGYVDIIINKQTKKQVADQADYFNDYWSSPEDPNYILLELNIKNIEYLSPGNILAVKFKMRD